MLFDRSGETNSHQHFPGGLFPGGGEDKPVGASYGLLPPQQGRPGCAGISTLQVGIIEFHGHDRNIYMTGKSIHQAMLLIYRGHG